MSDYEDILNELVSTLVDRMEWTPHNTRDDSTAHAQDNLARLAQMIIKNCGEIPLSFEFCREDPEDPEKSQKAMIVLPGYSGDLRGSHIVAVRRVCRKVGAFSCTIMSECWMSTSEEGALDAGDRVMPVDDPDRKEIVMIQTETLASSTVMVLDIVREDGKDATLVRQKKADVLQQVEGVYFDFFREIPVN